MTCHKASPVRIEAQNNETYDSAESRDAELLGFKQNWILLTNTVKLRAFFITAFTPARFSSDVFEIAI